MTDPVAKGPAVTDDPVVRVRDLRFSYGPGLPDVLVDVDLTVGRGEMVALLGQNGAGKTTLAKHLNGLHRPKAGTVEIAGRPVQGQPLAQLARTVGFCYQNPDHQIFSTSVEKEVAFGPHNLGYPPEKVTELVTAALDLVGLSGERDTHPFSLGRGQRQLVAVASVLAMDPPLLVIDEPTTGMDRVGATQVMELLTTWAGSGRSILAITHDMDLVTEYIPRAVVMAGGRVLADGPTQEVFRRDEVLKEAHLVAPAPVVISDRLRPYGLPRCRSIAEAVEHIAAVHAGGTCASRL